VPFGKDHIRDAFGISLSTITGNDRTKGPAAI